MGKNKSLRLNKKDREIIKHIATNGPSWYYELYKIHKIASNKTVLDTFKHLKSSLLEVKRKEVPQGTQLQGRSRTYYGLTFRGLNYALKEGFVDFDKVKKIVQDHEIKVPQITEADLDDYLQVISSHSSPFGVFLRPLLATMGIEKIENIIKIALEKFPEELFKNTLTGGLLNSALVHLDPLWSQKKYLKSLVVKAVYIIFENYKYVETRAEMIDIIGEDAFEVVRLMSKELEKLTQKETAFLKHIPRERRNEILRKLKQTR